MIRSILAGLAAALLAVPAVCAQASNEPQKVAEGVWGMATKGGANAGWFTFGDSVIAVDAGRSAADAEAILGAIARTTDGKPVSMLILTNNFDPHSAGAPVFARRGATVVCAERFGGAMLKFVSAPGPKGAKTPAPARSGAVLTVDKRLVLARMDRRVEIDAVGPADSGGDLIVYLPGEHVLFSGDLVANGMLPLLFSKEIDPDAWVKALGEISEMKLRNVVPGWGLIGPTFGVTDTREYIRAAWSIAQSLVEQKTPESVLSMRLNEQDVRLKGLPKEVYPNHVANVRALMERIREREAARAKPAANPKEP
jgi:cyclase